MININPLLLIDGYKVGHKFQYPDDTTLVYSNFTPRKSRIDGVPGVIHFGLQYFVKEYLDHQWNTNFFNREKKAVVGEFERIIRQYLGPTDVSHLEALHDHGFLPIKVKGIPEGNLVPFGVPVLTIKNTNPNFYWVTNMLETILSNVLWLASTSATTAFRYRLQFEKFARETGADPTFIGWQGHDFSFRGMTGVEAACLSGAGHLLSFTGTDTIPAIPFLENYYYANVDDGLVGGSVPATEHSVMSMGGDTDELSTFRRLITEVYPKGIVSIVSDTWDFWRVITEYLPALKEVILAREGKVVIRPDSGDPVKIICGDPESPSPVVRAGAISMLWQIFGGTVTDKGFRTLDPHIGLIYGDSITPERQVAILEGLKANGFASSNVVLGIGSYTYQHVTRDTYGFAMKATYGETLTRGGQAIYKDPKTDDGTKKSARGLLLVKQVPRYVYRGEGKWPEQIGHELAVFENVDQETEKYGALETYFYDGEVRYRDTLQSIRARVRRSLEEYKL